MNNATINQAYLFLIFILNGAFIGIIFDVFRILRKSFETPNIVTYIEDVLFWFLAALSVLYCLFVFNNGEIRGYLFIGLFLGIILYMLFFSKVIVKISVKIILFLKQLIYSIINFIAYPLKAILKIIKKILGFFEKIFQDTTKACTKKCQDFKIKSKQKKKLENKEGF